MATIYRTRAVFKTGGTGPDCLITNYWDSTGAGPAAMVTEALARVRAAFATANAILVTGSTLTINPVADEIDENTGAIVAQQTGTLPAANTFTGSGNWLPLQTQALVTKQTALFIGGRRVKGRQFIPGWTINSTTASGALTAAALTVLGNYNTALGTTVVTAINERVWHRPVGGSGGLSSVVTARGVSGNYSVLRSRRV